MCPGGGDASPTLNTEGGRVDPFFFPFVPPPPPPPPFALSSASGELAFRFDPRASPFPPLFFPSRLFIHRMRSATSRTPFAGSVAAILMYLHRLAYASDPYVSIPRSSTACSSLDHCASYRFVPVVPACEPDLTASAAAASSILVPTRLFPLFPLLTLPLTSDASAFMCAGGGMDADAGGGIICGIIPPPFMFMSMFEWCGLMSGLTSGTANASSLSKSGKWSSTSPRPLRCPRSNLSMETWCASWRSSPCVADGSSGSVIVRACSA